MRKRKYISQSLRWLFLASLIIALFCIFYFGWYKYLSYENLKKYHTVLLDWTEHHYLLSVISFMLLYVAVVALSVPGALFVTMTGGFLFGPWAIAYVVVSATIGAVIIFLAVRSTVGAWLAKKSRGWLSKMEKGFQKNAFSYLLFLRLIPIFPFWIINIVAGLLNVSLSTFTIATFIGIIPGSIVYVLIGNSLNYLFASNQTPDFNTIFKPEILLPLLALAVLALMPMVYKHWKRK